jgi:hypothetical protein
MDRASSAPFLVLESGTKIAQVYASERPDLLPLASYSLRVFNIMF